MEPFSRDELQRIRAWLTLKGASARDMALLETGVDSMLRCGDLVRLRVSDVRDFSGTIHKQFDLATQKTGETVNVGLTDKARNLLGELIAKEGKWTEDFLFTPQGNAHGEHISEVMLRKIVKKWAEAAHLDAKKYSGHSLRRTKAVFIYRETKDFEQVRVLLGHKSLAHTIKYLGIKGKDAAKSARSFDL